MEEDKANNEEALTVNNEAASDVDCKNELTRYKYSQQYISAGGMIFIQI